MVDGLVDIFSAIGILFGFIWMIASLIKDWRAKFILTAYIFLVFFIGALQQYNYPVNTRLMFLIPILSTISGVGYSRMLVLVTYFKKSRKIFKFAMGMICCLIFLVNIYVFFVKMPQKLQFTKQAYIMKFLQKYEKLEKIVVTSPDVVNLDNLLKTYKLEKNTVIYRLNQFETALKENKVKNKAVIFDSAVIDPENKISRLVKYGYTYSDNTSGNVLFYIYDFTNDMDYYNGFYELWTTGKTNYVLKIKKQMQESGENIVEETADKKVIKYRVNNKTQKFRLIIHKNFQFEKIYKAMRNSEIKNYKITKPEFNVQISEPSDIDYDNNLNILFVADSGEKRILKFLKDKEDAFVLKTEIRIPGKIIKNKRNEISDVLFITLNSRNETLYVLDSIEGKIYEIDYNGNLKKEIVQSDYIKNSTDITFSKNNNCLTVCNPEENLIMMFDINGILNDAYCTTRGIGEGQMNRPVSSEITKDNYILFADSLNGIVQLFDNNLKYIRNYRIGTCSRTQLPDIKYVNHPIKPYFIVTQPDSNRIFIYLLNEDAFRLINLADNKTIKFLNPSKITQCGDDFYVLDNAGKFIVRLQLPHNFILEKIGFPARR